MTMTRKHFEQFATSYGEQISQIVAKSHDSRTGGDAGHYEMQGLTNSIKASIEIFQGFNRGFDADRFNRRVLQVACNTMRNWDENQGREFHSEDNDSRWGVLMAFNNLMPCAGMETLENL